MHQELNEEEHVVDEGEGGFLNDVLNDEGQCVLNKGDDGGVVLVEGEADVVIEGESGMLEVEGDVVIEGEGNVLNDGNEADDDSNEANDEGHLILPKLRKRKSSMRITKLKLKNAVFNKDGGSLTCSNSVNLELLGRDNVDLVRVGILGCL